MHQLLDQSGIVSIKHLPARSPLYDDFPAEVHPYIIDGLKKSGINQLYAHQTQALQAVLKNKNIMITTSTASGKSLVYTIPILNSFISKPGSTALYLSPTKALGQNQRQTIQGYTDLINWPNSIPPLEVCDGDTPWDERRLIMNQAQLIVTTPDFLHAAALPRHRQWSSFFKNLQYIVVDEAHTYRGIFGNHVCQVFRRLRRICAHYGANPVFILCSATIANPIEFGQKLTGLPLTLVNSETCPTGEKTMVFYKPSGTSGELTKLAHFEAARIVSKYIKNNHRVIMFGRSKNIIESAFRLLKQEDTTLANKITPYKGTYTPERRRQLEEQLFTGQLAGVISTNALELGIDIGDLDVCVLCGFPGSIASTWQQSGRVGRSKQKSLVVLVASDDPLDRYMVHHSEFFFSQPSEKAIVNPHRLQFMVDHLPLAASELPLLKEDLTLWDQESYYNAVQFLRTNGRLRQDPSLRVRAYRSMGEPTKVGLRGEQERFLLKLPDGRIIEQTTYQDVLRTAYPGGILTSQGKDYFVKQVDTASKAVFLEPLPPTMQGRHTRPLIDVRITGVKANTNCRFGIGVAYAGELTVHRKTTGLKFIDPIMKERVEKTLLQELPALELPTSGIWLDILLDPLPPSRRLAALHTLEHLLRVVIPWHIMCERNDLGSYYEVLDSAGRIYIYDDYQGGVGLAESSLDVLENILQRCLDMVAECSCYIGCPSCIHIPQCEQHNEDLDKEGAILLLASLLNQPIKQLQLRRSKLPKQTTPISSGSGNLRTQAREYERQQKILRQQAEAVLSEYPRVLALFDEKSTPIEVKGLMAKEKLLLALLMVFQKQHNQGSVSHELISQAADLLHIERQFFSLRLEALVSRNLVYGSKERGYTLPSALFQWFAAQL